MKRNILIVVLAMMLMASALTKYRNIALTNSTIDNTTVGQTTPLAGKFTQLAATIGILNSGGFKHQRFTSCTTAASLGAFCQTSIAWSTPFADNNYTLNCQVSNGSVFITAQNNKTANGADVIIENDPGTSVAVSTQLQCIGIHD